MWYSCSDHLWQLFDSLVFVELELPRHFISVTRMGHTHRMEAGGHFTFFPTTAFLLPLPLPLPFTHNQPLERNQIHLLLVSVEWKLNPTKTKLWFEPQLADFENADFSKGMYLVSLFDNICSCSSPVERVMHSLFTRELTERRPVKT